MPPRDFSPDEEHDAGQPRTDWQPPGQRHANQRENAPDEGLVGQATEAMRNVAESASDLVQDTYETGARYAREGWDSLPEVDRYSRAVSRPVEQGPDDNGVGNHGGLAWVEGGTFPMPPERLKTGSVRRRRLSQRVQAEPSPRATPRRVSVSTALAFPFAGIKESRPPKRARLSSRARTSGDKGSRASVPHTIGLKSIFNLKTPVNALMNDIK